MYIHISTFLMFALRCVALLCALYARLRLVLFPSGGPYLPSLSVKIKSSQTKLNKIVKTYFPMYP
jgi:hypothetical protein